MQYVSSSDNINTIFKHCHLSLISENEGNLIIFRNKVLDIKPKSVCAVQMTMYFHWTCININRKDVHACVTGLDRSYQYSGGGCSEEVPQVLIWVRGYSCSGPGSKTSSQNQTKPLLHHCQEGRWAYY